MKLYILFTFLVLLILTSCNHQMPNWLIETNHSISPDGRAAIYSVYNTENKTTVVATWVCSKFTSGGAGIFDIKTSDSSKIVLSWLSDSIAMIEYPANFEIIRQEDSTYFFGRTIKVKYKIKD